MNPDQFVKYKQQALDAEEKARQAGRDFEDAGKAKFGKRFWALVFCAVIGMAVLGSMLAQCAAGG